MIQEERENIITNENTAQDMLKNMIESMTKPLKKVNINETLSGDVDLSIFKEMGFGIPEEITFTNGKITNIYNIPEGLLELHCSNNILISIENIPKSIEVLEVQNNYLKSIDVSALSSLEILNVSHNHLELLDKLPESLIELKCTHNKLDHLNLSGLNNLKLLHISNNSITYIENLPQNVPDFQMINTPSIEFRNFNVNTVIGSQENEKYKRKKDFVKAMNDYYKLKDKYENNLHKLRKRAYKNAPTKKMAKSAVKQVKAPCIKCKRPTGTIFTVSTDKLIAHCGDETTPCNLNINIYKGDFAIIDNAIVGFKEDLDTNIHRILSMKMQNIFDYKGEEYTKAMYNEYMKEYNLINKVYNDLIDKHNLLFNNKETIQNMKDLNKDIFSILDTNKELFEEYQKTNNREVIKTIVRNNINEVDVLARNLRNLKHEVMEMNYYDDEKIHKLYQFPVILNKLTTNIGEPESVVKYER